MRLVFLGTGAGGGVPQWNCNCEWCRKVRSGVPSVKPRLEAALAVTADGHGWVIVDAPPDLRVMLTRYDILFPRQVLRGTPVQAIVLLHGDVNHCAGLLTFRGPVTDPRAYVSVYATARLQRILRDRHPMFQAIKVRWHILPLDTWCPIQGPDGQATGLAVRAIAVPGKPPTYHWEAHPENTVAVQIRAVPDGPIVLYAPIVRTITESLIQAMHASDCIVLDGTFWSATELLAIDPHGVGGRQATEIGHIPVEDSLPVLARIAVPYRIYTHINNTNPLNDTTSTAYRQVTQAGITVASDGMSIQL